MIDEKVLEQVKAILVNTYDPEEIYVFGSYAWGTPDKESDLDLLIVIDQYKKDRFQTMSDGYRALYGLRIFKDILVYSRDEFDRYAADTTTLCNRVVQEGKMLYAKA